MGFAVNAIIVLIAILLYIAYDGGLFYVYFTMKPHGDCKLEKGLPGVEDLDFSMRHNIMVLSSDNRSWFGHNVSTSMNTYSNGKLAFWARKDIVACAKTDTTPCDTFYLPPIHSSSSSTPPAPQKSVLDFSSTAPTELTYFHPHGIHIFDPTTSTTQPSSLFVINHTPYGNTVELFDVVQSSDTQAYSLVHQRTVRHPLFDSINDVYALDSKRFYVSRFLYYGEHTLMSVVEGFTRQPWGFLFYCELSDDMTAAPICKTIFNNLRMPNGLYVSPDRRSLYLIETLGTGLNEYRIGEDPANLTLVSTIPLNSACDNLYVDENGALYTACHPSTVAFFLHSKKKSFLAPSQVLRIDMTNHSVQELVLSRGADLPASSGAVCVNSALVVGAVFAEGVLVCPSSC